nr:hypothetical protein [Candidatus Sigynarchaeota archaeon]
MGMWGGGTFPEGSGIRDYSSAIAPYLDYVAGVPGATELFIVKNESLLFVYNHTDNILGHRWIDDIILAPGTYQVVHELGIPQLLFNTYMNYTMEFTYINQSVDYRAPIIGDIMRPLRYTDEDCSLVLRVVEDNPITASNVQAWWSPAGTDSWQPLSVDQLTAQTFNISCDFISTMDPAIDAISFKFRVDDAAGNWIEYVGEQLMVRAVPINITKYETDSIGKVMFKADINKNDLDVAPYFGVFGDLVLFIDGTPYSFVNVSDENGLFQFDVPETIQVIINNVLDSGGTITGTFSIAGWSCFGTVSTVFDLGAPGIGEIFKTPEFPSFMDPVAFAVNVTDDADASLAWLYYMLDNETNWRSVSMSVVADYSTLGEYYIKTFSATIPACAAGTWVFYKIIVEDIDGIQVSSNIYSYTVSNTHWVFTENEWTYGDNSDDLVAYLKDESGNNVSGYVQVKVYENLNGSWEFLALEYLNDGVFMLGWMQLATLDVGMHELKFVFPGSGQYTASEGTLMLNVLEISSYYIQVQGVANGSVFYSEETVLLWLTFKALNANGTEFYLLAGDKSIDVRIKDSSNVTIYNRTLDYNGIASNNLVFSMMTFPVGTYVFELNVPVTSFLDASNISITFSVELVLETQWEFQAYELTIGDTSVIPRCYLEDVNGNMTGGSLPVSVFLNDGGNWSRIQDSWSNNGEFYISLDMLNSLGVGTHELKFVFPGSRAYHASEGVATIEILEIEDYQIEIYNIYDGETVRCLETRNVGFVFRCINHDG